MFKDYFKHLFKKMNLDTRLYRIQSEKGISRVQLASELNVSRGTLHNHVNQDKEDPSKVSQSFKDTVEDYEKELGLKSFPPARSQVMNEDQLVYGDAKEKFFYVPLLGWAHAGDPLDYEESDAEQLVPTECRDAKAFAVDIEGDSMEGKFSPGDRLIISPESDIYSGCYIIARFNQNGGVIFRKMEYSGEEIILVPENPRYPVKSHHGDEFDWIYPVWGRWTKLY